MQLGRLWRSIEHVYRGVARKPLTSVAVAAVWAFAMAAVGSAAMRFPAPPVADEASYLLAAETFAHGRLTNPPHPMARYFETYHVLQHPTYTSKYPPANALVIAAGWIATGHPIVGVWLSFALMIAALCWMLRAWVGDDLAFALAIALATWLSSTYWATSYWGGATAAIGGALTFGALRRIVDGRSTIGGAVILGLGLAVLANSRPYEGLMLSIPGAVVYLRWLMVGDTSQVRRRASQSLVPLAAVLVMVMLGMATYNRAVTGSWHELPYMAYQKASDPTPFFAWQTPASIAPSPHLVLEKFRAFTDSTYRAARTPHGLIDTVRRVFGETPLFFIPTALLFPLLLWPVAWRDPWIRIATACLLVTGVAVMLSTYYTTHYAAPAVALLLAVYGACLQWLARLRAGTRQLGRELAVAAVLLWTGLGMLNVVHLAQRTRAMPATWPSVRRDIAARLAADTMGSLVIVRYGAAHDPAHEWVYNGHDIDNAAVVWARDMGEAGNAPLLHYFAKRDAWLLTVNDDRGPFTLTPWSAVAAHSLQAGSVARARQ